MIDPVARANRWRAFYEEEGGLADILNAMAGLYLERMSSVEPYEHGKLSALSIAHKVTKEVAAQINMIMNEGTVAIAQREHLERIERIPEKRRRWLG